MKMLGGCFGTVFGGALATYALYPCRNKVTYRWSMPSVLSGTLCFQGKNSRVNTFQFITNGLIDGMPWNIDNDNVAGLMQSGSSFKRSKNTEGSYTYTMTYKDSGVAYDSQACMQFNFAYHQALGPLPGIISNPPAAFPIDTRLTRVDLEGLDFDSDGNIFVE